MYILFLYFFLPKFSPVTHKILASLGSRSSSSSFRELRRAQKQPLQQTSLDDLNAHQVYGYFSSPLLNDQRESEITGGYLNQLNEPSSKLLTNPSYTNDNDILTETQNIDNSNSDELISSNFMNQVQLATLRNLENQLINQLNKQEEKVDIGKGSLVSPSLSDIQRESTWIPIADAGGAFTQSKSKKSQKQKQQPSNIEQQQLNPYNYHSLANTLALNSNSYQSKGQKLIPYSTSSSTGSKNDNENGYLLNSANFFLDPIQFSSLISSRPSPFSSVSKGKNSLFISNSDSQSHLNNEKGKNFIDDTTNGKKKNDHPSYLQESIVSSNVNREPIEQQDAMNEQKNLQQQQQHQQQPPPLMDSSIDLPIEPLEHEPSSVFSQGNFEQLMKMQPASAHPLTSDDLRHLIESLTDDTMTSTSDGKSYSRLYKSNINISPPLDDLTNINGQRRELLKSLPIESYIYLNSLINSNPNIVKNNFNGKNSFKLPNSIDADALMLLENGNTGDASSLILNKPSTELTNDDDNDGSNIIERLTPYKTINLLENKKNGLIDSDNSNDEILNLNPPGYVSLDDANEYFSNVLDDFIGSKSNSPEFLAAQGETDINNNNNDNDDGLESILAKFLDSEEMNELTPQITNTIGIEGTPGITVTNVLDNDISNTNYDDIDDNIEKLNSILDPLTDEILKYSNGKFGEKNVIDYDNINDDTVSEDVDEDEFVRNTIGQILAGGSNSVKRNQVEEIKRLFTGSKRVDTKKPGPKLDWVS